MSRRRLTPEEVDLWRRVAERTERLSGDTPAIRATAPRPKPARAPKPRIPDFRIGQKTTTSTISVDPVRDPSDRLSAARIDMDQKAYRRMKRGKLKPEGRIDLHGMTLDHAHPALTRFILSTQASGKRLVLVITGKGRTGRDDGGPIPVPRGVLRHQVPQWLGAPPLLQAVIQVTTAHVSHGGTGAFYVYLRRTRQAPHAGSKGR